MKKYLGVSCEECHEEYGVHFYRVTRESPVFNSEFDSGYKNLCEGCAIMLRLKGFRVQDWGLVEVDFGGAYFSR